MSLFGDSGLWSSAADSLFFQESAVDKLLNAGEPELSVEALLAADTIVQDTQAQSPRLLDYITTAKALDRILFYLTIPQRTEDQDAAYRNPYMATEMLACGVKRILDTLLDRDSAHVYTLMAYVAAPAVLDAVSKLPQGHLARDWLASLPEDHRGAIKKAAAAGSGSSPLALPPREEPLRPYLAGYWCKVVTLLCRKRPADMVYWLDRIPGVTAHLAHNMGNVNFSELTVALLDLPFPNKRQLLPSPLSTFKISRRDRAGVADLLLGVLEGGLKAAAAQAEGSQQAEKAIESISFAQASACTNASEAIRASVTKAISSLPHAKYAHEGYNASRLRSSSASAPTAAQHSAADGSNNSGSAGGSGLPVHHYSECSADGVDAAQSKVNTQLDSRFHYQQNQQQQQQDSTAMHESCHMRVARDLRGDNAPALAADEVEPADENAGPHTRLVSLAVTAASLLAYSLPGGQDDEDDSRPKSAKPRPLNSEEQAACAAAFASLHALVDLCNQSWSQQYECKFPANEDGSAAVNSAGTSELASNCAPVGPCPPVMAALAQQLPMLVSVLERLCSLALAQNRSAADGSATSPASAGNIAASGSSASAAGAASGSSSSRHHHQSSSKARHPTTTALPPGVSPFPSDPNAAKLGTAGLALVKLLCGAARCGWPEVVSAATSCGLLPLLFEAMRAFPWHSIMHRCVTDCLVHVLRFGTPEMRRALLYEGALLSKLVSASRLAALPATMTEATAKGAPYNPAATASAAAAKPRIARVGYGGHLVALANAVISVYVRSQAAANAASAVGGVNTTPGATGAASVPDSSPSSSQAVDLNSLIRSHGDFWSLVHAEVAVANVQSGILIGGLAPDVSKSGNVGTAGDAPAKGAGGGAAVDEVAALDRKKEGDGDGPLGGRLSPSSDEGEDEHGGAGEERYLFGSSTSGAQSNRRGRERAPSGGSDDNDDRDKGSEGGSGGSISGDEEEEGSEHARQAVVETAQAPDGFEQDDASRPKGYAGFEDEDEADDDGEANDFAAFPSSSAPTAAFSSAVADFATDEWGAAPPVSSSSSLPSSSSSSASGAADAFGDEDLFASAPPAPSSKPADDFVSKQNDAFAAADFADFGSLPAEPVPASSTAAPNAAAADEWDIAPSSSAAPGASASTPREDDWAQLEFASSTTTEDKASAPAAFGSTSDASAFDEW